MDYHAPTDSALELDEAAGIDIGEVRDIICCKFTRPAKVDGPILYRKPRSKDSSSAYIRLLDTKEVHENIFFCDILRSWGNQKT
jgi:hypothetical protein